MNENKHILLPIDYETRNLGIPSFAVCDSFSFEPDIAALKNYIAKLVSEHSRIFVQARIAANNSYIIQALQKAGLMVVESTLVPYSLLKKNQVLANFIAEPMCVIPKKHSNSCLRTVRLEKNDSRMLGIIRTIASESFTQDRFHIDTCCTTEVADRRFVYWVDDLLADTKVIFYATLRDAEPVGFMARKEEHLILAGFSQRYAASGLGDFMWLSVMEDMLCEGHTQTHTLISTNNIPVLNLYVRLGFKFKDPCVTLHYWS